MTTNPTPEHKEQARTFAEIQNLANRLQCTCVGERADHHAQCPVTVGAEIIAIIKPLIPIAPARNLRTRDAAWLLVYDFEMVDCRCDQITLTAGAKANLEQRITAALSSRDTEIREVLGGFIHAGVEFDDERMSYVVMQIDRRDLKLARTLYAKLQPRWEKS